jgi:hypothetical protein
MLKSHVEAVSTYRSCPTRDSRDDAGLGAAIRPNVPYARFYAYLSILSGDQLERPSAKTPLTFLVGERYLTSNVWGMSLWPWRWWLSLTRKAKACHPYHIKDNIHKDVIPIKNNLVKRN